MSERPTLKLVVDNDQAVEDPSTTTPDSTHELSEHAQTALELIDDVRQKLLSGHLEGVAVMALYAEGNEEDNTTGTAWSSACEERAHDALAGMDFLRHKFLTTWCNLEG